MTEKYINVNAFIGTLKEMQKEFGNWSRSFGKTATCVLEETINKLQSFPAVNATPVVHAHWIPKKIMIRSPEAKNYNCSACGKENFAYPSCPYCRAIMDEEVVKDGQTEYEVL